jgi:hypothetical protein
MTIKKGSSDSRSKKAEDRERVWLKTDDAAQSIRDLIRSTKMNAEH